MQQITRLVLLSLILGVGAEAAYARLDPQADASIDHIISFLDSKDGLSLDKQLDLAGNLGKAAAQDRNVEKALAFGEIANKLFSAGRNVPSHDEHSHSGVLQALVHDSKGSLWNSVIDLDKNYRSDGVLPAVNYHKMSSPDGAAELGYMLQDER